MKQELEDILNMARKKLKDSISIFDEIHSYSKSNGEDEDQARAFASYIIESKIIESDTLLRLFAIINGYKRDDQKVFFRANNCISYLSDVLELIDSTYPVIKEIKGNRGRIMNRIKKEMSLEEFNNEVFREYKSWNEVNKDINNLGNTHTKVAALYILDFIKFMDFFVENYEKVIFDESEFEQADALFEYIANTVTVLKIKRGDKMFYKKYGIVPNKDIRIQKLRNILRNVKITGFKTAKKTIIDDDDGSKIIMDIDNAWDFLKDKLIGRYKHSQNEFFISDINLVQETLSILGDRTTGLNNEIELNLKTGDKSLLEDFDDKYSKVKLSGEVIEGDNIINSWYFELHSGLYMLHKSLYHIFLGRGEDRRGDFGLPEMNEEEEKDRMNKELIIRLAKKYAITFLDDYIKTNEIFDRITRQMLNNELRIPVEFTEDKLKTMIEIHSKIDGYLRELKEGLEGTEETEEPGQCLLKPLVCANSLSLLLLTNTETYIDKWNDLLNHVEANFSKEITWATAQGAEMTIDTLINKDYRIPLKHRGMEKFTDLFIINEITYDTSDITTITGNIEDGIKEYDSKKRIYDQSKKYMKKIKKLLYQRLLKTEQEINDYYDIGIEILKGLLEFQAEINEIEVPMILEPGNPNERFNDIIEYIPSLNYENDYLNAWSGLLESAASITSGKNLFYYKEKIKGIKAPLAGQKKLKLKYAYKNKLD